VIALLDINCLVALFDPRHCHHEAAHRWLTANRSRGWATCPLTENGWVRVVSNPAYPGRRTSVADAVARMNQFRRSGHHTFWDASPSLCDLARFHHVHIAGHRQITDVCLLAVAVIHGGRLATFDRRIPLTAVAGASRENLEVIPA
jgi:toxin-antitoxin system PIN domain toxin